MPVSFPLVIPRPKAEESGPCRESHRSLAALGMTGKEEALGMTTGGLTLDKELT
jgi:hypothetical protein